MKNSDTIYFLNYSNSNNIRSTDVELFYSIEDLEAFKIKQVEENKNLYGYVVFQKFEGDNLVDSGIVEYIGGFQPSAQELLNIATYTRK